MQLREQDREMRMVTALCELLAVLNSHRALAEILEYLLAQTAEVLDSDACAIYLLELENGEPILKVGASRGMQLEPNFRRRASGAGGHRGGDPPRGKNVGAAVGCGWRTPDRAGRARLCARAHPAHELSARRAHFHARCQ